MRRLTEYEKAYVTSRTIAEQIDGATSRVTFEIGTMNGSSWEEALFPCTIEGGVLKVHENYIDMPIRITDMDSPSTITGDYVNFLQLAALNNARYYVTEHKYPGTNGGIDASDYVSLYLSYFLARGYLFIERVKETFFDAAGNITATDYYGFPDGEGSVEYFASVLSEISPNLVVRGNLQIEKVVDMYHIGLSTTYDPNAFGHALIPFESSFPADTPPKFVAPEDIDGDRVRRYYTRLYGDALVPPALRAQAWYQLLDRRS